MASDGTRPDALAACQASTASDGIMVGCEVEGVHERHRGTYVHEFAGGAADVEVSWLTGEPADGSVASASVPAVTSPAPGPGESSGTATGPSRALPPVVCLCGSTRFREAFERTGREETLKGAIVLTVNDFDAYGGPQRGQQDLAASERAAADELHRRKIDMADAVLIVSEGGYFGESTAGEIRYAAGHGKPVRFAESAAQGRAEEMGLI